MPDADSLGRIDGSSKRRKLANGRASEGTVPFQTALRQGAGHHTCTNGVRIEVLKLSGSVFEEAFMKQQLVASVVEALKTTQPANTPQPRIAEPCKLVVLGTARTDPAAAACVPPLAGALGIAAEDMQRIGNTGSNWKYYDSDNPSIKHNSNTSHFDMNVNVPVYGYYSGDDLEVFPAGQVCCSVTVTTPNLATSVGMHAFR